MKNMPTPFVLYDFDSGDPPGKWTIECWLDEANLGKFDFEVIRGKPGETESVVVEDEVKARRRPPGKGPI